MKKQKRNNATQCDKAVEQLTDMVMEHLSKFPPEKQEKLLQAAEKVVSKRKTKTSYASA